MPVMDGLAALPKLLAANPEARIIMASTLTQRNAAVSLKALTLGATDYIAKPTTDKLNASEDFRRDLIQQGDRAGPEKSAATGHGRRVRRRLRVAVTCAPNRRAAPASSPSAVPPAVRRRLLTLLGALPPSVECPIVIAQHMPATFTTVLAQHIARASGRPCAEAADGMEIKPGTHLSGARRFSFSARARGRPPTSRGCPRRRRRISAARRSIRCSAAWRNCSAPKAAP